MSCVCCWTSLSVNPWGGLQHRGTAGFVYPGTGRLGFGVPGLVTDGWGLPWWEKEGANTQAFAGEMDTVHKAIPQRRTDTNCTYYILLLCQLVG